MMYPYAEFLIDFDRKHGSYTHRNAPENTRAAVIIETRPLFFLPKVVRNTMFFLGPRWNLHIFSGERSHHYFQKCFRDWSVTITKIQKMFSLSTAHYNGIMMSPSFWNGFTEEKLLIFQSDTLLCGPNVEDFTRYDYIGAPCLRFTEQYVANGGLSLRTRQLMLDCLARFKPKEGVPEDVYFTMAAREMGVPMADMDTACRFAVETLYKGHPVGVHGTDKCFHSPEDAEKIARAIRY